MAEDCLRCYEQLASARRELSTSTLQEAGSAVPNLRWWSIAIFQSNAGNLVLQLDRMCNTLQRLKPGAGRVPAGAVHRVRRWRCHHVAVSSPLCAEPCCGPP